MSAFRDELARLFATPRAWVFLGIGMLAVQATWLALLLWRWSADPRGLAPGAALVAGVAVAALGASMAGPPDALRRLARLVALAAAGGVFAAFLALIPLTLIPLSLIGDDLRPVLGAALAIAVAVAPAVALAAIAPARPVAAFGWTVASLAVPWLAHPLAAPLPGAAADRVRLGSMDWRLARLLESALDAGDLLWFASWTLAVVAVGLVAGRAALVLAPPLPLLLGLALAGDWPVAYRMSVVEGSLLSRETVATVRGLSRDVSVAAAPGGEDGRTAALLRELDRASPRISVGWGAGDPGDVVVTGGTRRVTVRERPLDIGEADLHQAIVQADRGAAPVVAFVTGHAEASPARGAAGLGALFERDGYEVRAIDLLGDGLPEDVDVLVVLNPREPWAPTEDEAVAAWIESGGAAFVVATGDGFLPDFVEAFGVGVGPRAPVHPAFVGSFRLGPHVIARGVIGVSGGEGWSVGPFPSADRWAGSVVGWARPATPVDGPPATAVDAVVAVERPVRGGQARLVLAGMPALTIDENLVHNERFLLSSVRWLADELRPPALLWFEFFVTEVRGRHVTRLVALGLLPLVLLAIGARVRALSRRPRGG